MNLSDYIITPADVWRIVRSVSYWHAIAIITACGLYIGISRFYSSDVAILVSGIVYMSFPTSKFRLPLWIAIAGLLCLMILSPFARDENIFSTWSESIAVGVFFMLIFGVYRMLLDELFSGRTLKSRRDRFRKARPIPQRKRSYDKPVFTSSSEIHTRQTSAQPPTHNTPTLQRRSIRDIQTIRRKVTRSSHRRPIQL